MLRALGWILPLAAGAAAAVAHLFTGGGRPGVELALVIAGGVLLGWATALMLSSVALLVNHLQVTRSLSDMDLLRLERDKEMLLRAIKDVELDRALQKLDEQDAASLCSVLREQALTLLRRIDEARAESGRSVTEQIRREVQRRVHRAPAGGAR